VALDHSAASASKMWQQIKPGAGAARAAPEIVIEA